MFLEIFDINMRSIWIWILDWICIWIYLCLYVVDFRLSFDDTYFEINFAML